MLKVQPATRIARDVSSPPPAKRATREATLGIAAIALLALVAIAAYFGYGYLAAPAPPPAAPEVTAVKRGTISAAIGATGSVAPLTQAKLSFRSNGRVAEVSARPGDAVTKGQVLARLDAPDLTMQVSQAKAQLSVAEAKLANVKSGSRAEELKAAQLQLDATRNKLDLMLAGGRPEEIASAKAGLDSAKATLSQVSAGPLEVDLRAAEQGVADAEAALRRAQADLTKLQAGPTAEAIRRAELAVEQAKNKLWSAQTKRDGVCGNTKSAGHECGAENASVAAADTEVSIARSDLVALKAPARPEELAALNQAVVSAQAQLTTARARLRHVQAGPSTQQLVAAQAAVVQAEQALLLKLRPYTEADVLAQRQAVAQAEMEAALKQLPYSDADLKTAQAAVDQAREQLELAQYSLANAVLVAPFAGVVGAVAVNAGEAAGSGPAVTVLNTKDLRLDVNVDEADIAQIKVGNKTKVTFDAIPKKTFSGKVTAIAPSAVVQTGIATYAVSISLDEPEQVKPGMTGSATITYLEQANVLTVPNEAVQKRDEGRVVEVLVGGQSQARLVKVGLSNDKQSEIVEGLAEGEQVLIPSTSTKKPQVSGGATDGQLKFSQ